MQTSKGNPAKKMTRDEFVDAVKQAKDASEACVAEFPEFYSKGGPYYSWDNASWHQALNLEDVGLKESDKWQLPPNSPDMHKVIEHVVGRVKQQLRHKLCDNANINSSKEVQAAFIDVFYKQISTESIRKDIESLPSTYKHIHGKKNQGGSEGDWAQARYR
jgi:hypothetical protein